jgi:serine/threonine protein kinase
MNDQHWSKAQALYLEAEGLTAEARSEFLDQACGDDAKLRAEIEGMLRGDSETRAVSESEPSTLPGDSENPEVPAGTRLGAWRIARRVGRGGMGEIYEAQRADGTFELRAAVKLLKRGLDTDAVVARFNRERRILAQLDHPNIAHVLDAGVAPDGRPFLVMEYVDGRPLSEYARDQNLPVPDLLRLIFTTCDAVQAAHAKKIVHRDLKPSNVLVTPQGQVKLLDFGIAKALEGENDSEATRLGESTAMTLAYAAPEQLLGLPATPATDVYALGCILYQLLVEKLPHARGGRSTGEIARDLKWETVERPSTVLRNDRGRLPEPLRMARLKTVSRDLDLIVLKALHPEARRRYLSASELADDLKRLLDHRPVLARPDSPGYRMKRFVQRNRLPVAAAAAVIVALAAGLTGALWQAHAAVLARNDATHRKELADGLINFMLGDLKDRLDEVGRLDVLDSTVGKAVGYIGGGDLKAMDDQTLAQRATVLDQIAGIQRARGQPPQALATSRAAMESARELQGRQPGARSDRLLANALYGLAQSADELNDDVTSNRAAIEGSGLTRRLLANQASDDELTLLLAKYDEEIANADVIGANRNFAEADARLRDCIHRLQQLTANPRILEQLIACEDAQVFQLFQAHRFDETAVAAAAFVAQAEDVHRRYADVTFLEFDLLGSLGRAAGATARMERPDLANRASALALDIGARLTALEPGNMQWLRSYAQAVFFDLVVRMGGEDWGDARKDADLALALSQKVLQHFPDEFSARMVAIQIRDERADLEHAVKRNREAIAEAAAGLALLRDGDQSTEMLEEGKLPLLARQWYYAVGVDPPVVRQAQAATRQLLAQLSTRPDAHEVAYFTAMADYLDRQCVEADRLRDKLIAEHEPEVDRLQKYRDAGCGKGRTAAR